VVNVADPTAPRVVKTIHVGTHPSAVALNPQAGELYVANSDSDSISVINTDTNLIIRKISLAPFFAARVGSSPDALAVSPDGETLYVANATDNDVAVISLAEPGSLNAEGAHDEVEGLIPTGWFPAGVLVSPDGGQLYVINAKGLGAGPNPNGPNPYKTPESGADQYVGSMMVGTLSFIGVPNPGRLRQYTEQVFRNNHFPGADGAGDDGQAPPVRDVPRDSRRQGAEPHPGLSGSLTTPEDRADVLFSLWHGSGENPGHGREVDGASAPRDDQVPITGSAVTGLHSAGAEDGSFLDGLTDRPSSRARQGWGRE
jgi:YVTN family beta-propeller protein